MLEFCAAVIRKSRLIDLRANSGSTQAVCLRMFWCIIDFPSVDYQLNRHILLVYQHAIDGPRRKNETNKKQQLHTSKDFQDSDEKWRTVLETSRLVAGES